MTDTKKPDRTDVHVGSKVRSLRLQRGLSQTALGDEIGVTFQQIQKYEKGMNRIGSSRLQQIATAMGVQPAYFFEGAPATRPSGEAPDDPFAAIASTRLGIELARAFRRIDDDKNKRLVVQLCEALAQPAQEG